MGIRPRLLNVRAELAALEGDIERSMVLFRRSLEMKPDQGEIRAFLEDLATQMQKNITESPSEP